MKKIVSLIALIVLMIVSTLVVVTAQQRSDVQANLISLELKDTPVRTAIDSLFKGTGLNYAIEPGVTGTIPNLSLKDVTFDQALKTLTKAAGLTYRKESGDVYLIAVKKAETSIEATGPVPAVDTVAMETPVEIDRKVEKLPLNYADAMDIAGIFGGQGFSSRSSSLAFGGGGMGGMGGGMRGGMGGGMMGGMGGGMMGGGMGGGMMGGGGFGGGMMGGMGGGFGGGGFGGGGFGGGGFGGGGFGGGGRIGF